MLYLLFFLLLFSEIFFATINIVQPTKESVDNSYYAGIVGPGQVLLIAIDKKVETGGRFNKGGYYDKAYAINLPKGWNAEPSKIFDNPLHVYITVPQDAEEGLYSFLIQLEDLDNAELLGNKTINITVRVSKDIFDFSLKKKLYVTGPKQPLRIVANINNKGSASDIFVFEIATENEIRKKEVFVPLKSNIDVIEELSFDAKGKEKLKVSVYLKQSPYSIKKVDSIDVLVEGNFFEDLGASGTGVLLLFIPFQPIYNILYLIYSILS